MFVLPLNLRIFKLLVGLIGLTTLAILFAQWFSTSHFAERQVKRDLDIGQRVVQQIFESRERLLFNSADVLTQDFGFKSALASGDHATIQSALSNHGERIASDLMVAMSLDGNVLASSGKPGVPVGGQLEGHPIIQRVIENGGAASMVVLGQQIYQAIFLIVEAPDPVAISMVAFEVNKELLAQIEKITKLKVILTAQSPDGPILISSLERSDAKDALAAVGKTLGQTGVLFNDSNLFVASQFDYRNDTIQAAVKITLADRLGIWYSDFNLLLKETFLIATLSIIIALAIGLLFANNLTRPLAKLVQRARAIAAGDYSAKMPLEAKSIEINRLGEAFDVMQHDIQEREAQIKFQAQHDALTQLYNRSEIGNILGQRLKQGSDFQVVAFKALGFRQVNTAFGLQSGDACMVSLANRIRQLGGEAARLNGSEILWLPSSVIEETALKGIVSALEQTHELDGIAIKLPLAAGYMHLPDDASSVDQLFSKLSAVVDHAVQHSESLVAYTTGLEEARIKRLSMLVALEQELESDGEELSLFYQPKLSLKNGRIEAVEALIRWNSKTLGFVPPDDFIPVAEKAGLIDQVTRWVVRRAIRDVGFWQEQGVELKVAINLSVHDISNVDLMDTIDQSLKDAGLSSEIFEFEITESDLMSDPETAIRLLSEFRDRGFDLAIDDFGTGYSSLAYLKNMPVSELKIDKSFILELVENDEDQLIVKSIIDLAKRFDLKIVAEGIEDEGALKLLREWGCDWAQGYFISRPIDPSALLVWLKNNQDTQWLKYA